MSKNKVRNEDFSRHDEDKHGNKIPIYRRKDTYLSKNELEVMQELDRKKEVEKK